MKYLVILLVMIAFAVSLFSTHDAFASGHDTCEPDMYGNLWCDPPVEDRLTLERFLFEPPIVNEKPILPMGLVILIISVIIIGVFVVIRKNKMKTRFPQ